MLLSGACGTPEEPSPTDTPAPIAATCDAGDEAFIARAMPLAWGRKPHGAAEVKAWAAMAARYGRDTVVQAMTHDPTYVARWSDWVMDALGVARTGDRSYAACFGNPLLSDDDGDLARFIRATPSSSDHYAQTFNMADVVASALRADDLSVAYRANLFARMNRPLQGANVGPYELEDNRRGAFGDEFFSFYLSRDMTCLACHNSEYSVTGSSDPAEDRTWEIPGLFEKALLGNSFGIDHDTAYAVFRYVDLMDEATATESPWGINEACGVFTPASSMTEDYLDHEGYFIQAFGESGSVWQVEAYLQQGVEDLARDGLQVAASGEVDPPEAFAWLVGQSIADQVWEEASGYRLTIANAFPRNQAQRDRLQTLTASLVDHGFSLRSLLVAVTADPYFNQGAPSTCRAQAYGLEPVYDPWVITDVDPAKRKNGPGDQVHRHRARTLIRSVHDSLGWAQPAPFLATGDPMAALETNLGAWMRVSQPGFNGTDFQGALAFENTYGACGRPDTGGAGDGCRETPGYGGCASCGCQSCVCGEDPYCCDVQWDALCVSMCNSDCGGCGGGLAGNGEDTIDRLLKGAADKGATVGDVVSALKDRLIARGSITSEEQGLIEALLSAPLDRPMAEAGDLEPALRVLCGAILISPDYFLSMDAGPAGEVPMLALDVEADCQRAAALMAQVGVKVTCSEGVPQ
jgi:hypothetical protein